MNINSNGGPIRHRSAPAAPRQSARLSARSAAPPAPVAPALRRSARLHHPYSIQSVIPTNLIQEEREIFQIIKNSYTPGNITTIHKDLRGLVKKPDLARSIQTARHHILMPIKDREQCDKTIGQIDCFGKIKCYLCGEPIITHVKNFRQNCKDVYNELKTPLRTSIPWLNERNQSIDNDSPECDHIMPCSPLDENLNGWGLNHILYGLLAKLLKVKGNDIPFSDAGSVEYDEKYYDYLKINYSSNYKLKYFLNAIIKSNYGWTHRICNNKKLNHTCIDVTKNSAGIKTYTLNNAKLEDISDKFIRSPQWIADIFNHFNKLKTITGKQLLVDENFINASDLSKFSMNNKMVLICLILNENQEYENYTPTTSGNFRKNIYGGLLNVSSIPPSDIPYLEKLQKKKKYNIDKEKIKIIAEKILNGEGENEENKLKRLNTFLFLMDIDDIKDTIKYKKVVEELNEIYEDFLKNNDESNEIIDELKEYLNFLNRQLPEYKSNYNQDYLQYIQEITNTHEFELFKQLILFDFTKFEKFKCFSFFGNFAKNLIDNKILTKDKDNKVILNVENPKIKYTHYKQTFFFNNFNEKNEIKEDMKKTIIDNLKKLNPDVDVSDDDKLIKNKLLDQFEERYNMIDDKTKLNDIYINWYYFHIFQLFLIPDDKMQYIITETITDNKDEIGEIIEEIKKIKKIMPVTFSKKFAIKVQEANNDETKMQELFQDVRRTYFQLSIGYGLLYNDEKK